MAVTVIREGESDEIYQKDLAKVFHWELSSTAQNQLILVYWYNQPITF